LGGRRMTLGGRRMTLGGRRMTLGGRRLGVIGVLLAQIAWAGTANAAGALAVGVAPGGAQLGFSYGLTSAHNSDGEAQTVAVNACRGAKESNKAAQAGCMLISTFTNQCAAVAMDPKNGTPGVGWAVGADAATANRIAVASCEATAGPGRAGTCKVSATRCDGSAQ
jgi:hypothetical protein